MLFHDYHAKTATRPSSAMPCPLYFPCLQPFLQMVDCAVNFSTSWAQTQYGRQLRRITAHKILYSIFQITPAQINQADLTSWISLGIFGDAECYIALAARDA